MHTHFWERISYDQLMLLAVSAGVLARLCDNQTRTLIQSAKQLFFSLSTGAAFTALLVGVFDLAVGVQAAAAFLLTLFASVIVEIIERKAHELRDTHLKEWVAQVAKLAWDELKKYLPLKPKTT